MQNELVFDIETKKSFEEVGGKRNMHLLGVSIVGVYNYADDSFVCYEEKDFPKLEDLLRTSPRLIGFNSKHFDVPVLQPHVQVPLAALPHLDLMEDIETYLGFRVSLDSLARSNLGVGKSGNGLDAIMWWQTGNIEAIKKYCLDDVRITRDLYEYGKRNGSVLAETRNDPRVSVPVTWQVPTTAFAAQASLF
ncbi:MAG: DEAD/DEAH box helicase domain-containing protein [Parcubacteria group bacterium Gr01-1014_70]|nr:MAG: DEAD/DEAH box helicase domain-containing protein [Parcubacteria group bacterium Gr01-1014_70]